MFGQGALWLKLAGGVLGLMLLATSTFANPQLDPANPTSFFTNVAMGMFQEMDLHDFNGNLVTVTNIPIYEDPARFGGTNINYYTPAVHRILQVAANILDATTNRFVDGGPTNYPTVFRPVFTSQNGEVWISGYQEVTNPTPALNFQYWDAGQAAATPGPLLGINIYGVPWVIGAKKGFPDFNEFSMENALTVSRKLEFTNVMARPPWWTNQVLDLTITNAFGLEAWNSYTNAYGRPLQLICSNTMSIVISNENGFPLLKVDNLAFGNVLSLNNGWPGWSESPQTLERTGADDSFVIPMVATNVFTNGIYRSTSPQVIPLEPPIWAATFVPHLFMNLHIRLQFILIDTTVDRVIDFVNIDSQQPAVDIATILQGTANGTVPSGNPDEEWDTNLVHGVPIGILNQIEIGEEGVQSSDWQEPPEPPLSSQQVKDKKAYLFRNHLDGNSPTNYFEAPYTPKRTIHQRISWQANDPLVHYMAVDMTSTNGIEFNDNMVTTSFLVPPLGNLGEVNFACQPWGGRHVPGGSSLDGMPFDYDYRVKDPGVQQSDDWDFPTGESLGFEWLARVHRGTPWQTIDLKPSPISENDWVRWDNDNVFVTNGKIIFVDSSLTHPANDWGIASLWAQWVDTNDLSTLLSINNTDTNAWAARLDGLIALTNSAPGELDAMTIASNSPQAGMIAQAIQMTRANTNSAKGTLVVFQNGMFQQVGDVLATPELSAASPFIDTNGLNSVSAGGLNDEALEKIPTQLIPLLRLDSFGHIAPANGQLQLSFSGYDGHTYVIQASSNLTDWVTISTNSPSDGSFGITNSTTSGQQFYRSVLMH